MKEPEVCTIVTPDPESGKGKSDKAFWDEVLGDDVDPKPIRVVGLQKEPPKEFTPARPVLKGTDVKEAYDEEKHKRAPKGSPKGGQFIKKGRELGGAESSKIREDVLRRFARDHSHDTIERAIIVGDDGNILVEKSGGVSEIEFTEAEMETMKGATLIHNHPSGSSFSPTDIKLADWSGLREMQAVGRSPVPPDEFQLPITYLYSMKMEGWHSLSQDEVNAVHKDAESDVKSRIGIALLVGNMSINEANTIHMHLVWERMAQYAFNRYGVDLGYSRTEIKS